ncbi:MAG: TonB family protein, partial [Gammaproteobacteria bacterium]|nr:TonB family protein [Gammaproteobacteria bacterium]
MLHQCLADGSTSRLFRALDRRRQAAGDPDPWVVLKVVTAPPDEARSETEHRALQALRREAAIAQGLEHPNLPRILGIDHEGPHTFVCTAWIEGESLAAILDSRGTRPMTRVQALHILDGVGRALIHLHAHGITHADVKPGNIVVTAEGEAVLLDFGVSVGPGADDLPAVRGFTPEYASPEVLAGDEPAPSDDLFSLACVAYRMLGGHRAFGAVTAREAAADGSRPERPAHLSPAQWRALDRGLAFARAERQPDVATFLAQLKGARDESLAVTDLRGAEPDAPLPATPPSALDRPDARPRRSLPATVLVLAIVGLIGIWWLQRPAEPVPAPSSAELPRDTAVNESPAGEPSAVPAGTSVPQPTESPILLPPAPAKPGPAQGAAPTEAPAAAPATPARPRPGLAKPGGGPAAGRPEPAVPPDAGPREPPAELAGPPLPEPGADYPVTSTAAPTAPSPGGPPADTAPGRTVPFSSLTVRRYVEPAYPRNAAARRLPGWVDVVFTVEPSGRTRDVQVAGADPPGVFDDAAVAAVRRWRF